MTDDVKHIIDRLSPRELEAYAARGHELTEPQLRRIEAHRAARPSLEFATDVRLDRSRK
jgi:hypothetical protein